jgi:transposase
METRELKAMQIAATTRLRRTAEAWIVPSQSVTNASYRVVQTEWVGEYARADRPNGWQCTCPDFELRQQPCKHILAVEFTVRREITDEGEVVTQTVSVTYSQEWSAYNAAQCSEKDRFMPMLADLCSTIPNPPQGKGRPRLPRSDMAFNCVARIYSGLSARRADSDVREAEAKGLTDSDPHFNSVLRYLRDPEMTPILKSLVELSALPLKGAETDFAVDATGFSTSRFERWYDHKWGQVKSKREWMKLHAITGVRTNVVTAVDVTSSRVHDTTRFKPLVSTTAENFPVEEVSADKAYISKSNLDQVEKFGGTPYIPYKSNMAAFLPAPSAPAIEAPAWERMFHMFAYQKDTFLAHYHKRSNVETTFSMIKAKFGDSLRSKSEVGQINEVLAKVIAHNLCVLIACMHEIGLELPSFHGSPVG